MKFFLTLLVTTSVVFAKESQVEFIKNLEKCNPYFFDQTPEYLKKRSKIRYTNRIKGLNNGVCIIDVDMWTQSRTCKIPKDKLNFFKTYRPKYPETIFVFQPELRGYCKSRGYFVKNSTTAIEVSTLVAPLLSYAKVCDEQNDQKACEKYRKKLEKINSDCGNSKPSSVICKKYKTAEFK